MKNYPIFDVRKLQIGDYLFDVIRNIKGLVIAEHGDSRFAIWENMDGVIECLKNDENVHKQIRIIPMPHNKLPIIS